MAPAKRVVQERQSGLLKIDDVLGRHVVETRTHGRISVREESAAGALKVLSRWVTDPRRLPCLPPTMSPAGVSRQPGYLEHPVEAFADYRAECVSQVLCKEKHMSSRAVVLLTRDILPGLGAAQGWHGTVYTRTGRAFFGPEMADELLTRLDLAVEQKGMWHELGPNWIPMTANSCRDPSKRGI